MFSVIIAGSRSFNNYSLLKEKCDFYLCNISDDIEIVSGCAKGADELGIRYAKERGYELNLFPAQWDKFGKSAGMRRNPEMAHASMALIAFWDGKSVGTLNMIDLAIKNDLFVRIVRF